VKKDIIVCFSILAITFGCSIKKKIGPLTSMNSLELKSMPDSDNDGIPDEIEKKNGTNPYIADIPKISIGLVQDISIGAIFKMTLNNLLGSNEFAILRQEFSEIDANKGGDLDSLKVLRRKVIINQYNHLRNVKAQKQDIITNDDLRTNILSSWTDDLYYPFMDSIFESDKIQDNDSGKFTTNLKIKISNALNVTEISDISLKSFFYDFDKMEESEIYNHFLLKSSGSKERLKLNGSESYSPVTVYPLIANELKSKDILLKINDRSEIGIKFTDYSYTTSGIQLNYAETLNKVFEGDARIIYSDGFKTEVFFVSPTLTLNSALLQVGKKIKQNKDFEIYSVNGIETTAKYPIDVDTIKRDDFSKGIWSIFGDADNLNDQLKAQGIYVVSYISIKDILTTSRRWADLNVDQISDSITLENIFEGDELLIDLSDLQQAITTEGISQKIHDAYCTGAGCNFTGPGTSCKCTSECLEINSTPVIVESSLQIPINTISSWFKFEDSYGEHINAQVYKYGNKINIKFNSLGNHLKNKIKLIFKNPNDAPSIVRSGRVGGSCSGGSNSSQTFNNHYKIIGSVKVLGINKY
jgi:hypothetical protein